MKDAADKYEGQNLYLKNLDDGISDDQLRELFSSYGKITSCKVLICLQPYFYPLFLLSMTTAG
jgi:hypothetical protein